MKQTISLALSLLLLFSLFSPLVNAEEGVVTIGSVEELIRFSNACKVENYSAGKVFSLTADLDLRDSAFTPISYFAGTFNGNGHTITGLDILGDGSRLGFFRRLSPDAAVNDLRIKGSVTPGGSGLYVGGIVGENHGRVTNCFFEGSVAGTEAAGGIAGHNAPSGQIRSCVFAGSIHGEHQIGGISGWNEGTVTYSTNAGQVNTVPVTPREREPDFFNLSLLDVSAINADDFLDLTDIGGICGENGGVIQHCSNNGAVGYPNTAYNVGGIVGKTSGLVSDCENRGDVQGRKDVGGIAGQLIPYTELDLSRNKLDALSGEINALKELIAAASQDAASSASWIMGDLGGMNQAADWVISVLNRYIDVLDLENLDILERIQALVQIDPETGELIFDPSLRYDEATGEFWFGDSIRFNPQTGQVWKNGVLLLPPDTSQITDALNYLFYLSTGLSDRISGTVGTLAGDITNISNQISWVFDTMFSTIRDLTDLHLDVADLSTLEAYRRDRGAVAACKNSGSVLCETNGGGIVGASAFEIAFDMEDRLNASDLLLSHGTEFLFAAVRDCESGAEITVGKNNAGGIAGLVDVGTVINCTASGLIRSNSGDQVGGIAGRSRGSIVKCRSCVILEGGKYVGGIAGLGENISACAAAAQIEKAKEYAGAVAGWCEGKVQNNVYTLSSYAGVDDASLTGECEPVSEAAFLRLDGIPKDFTRVQIQLLCEGNVVETRTLAFGAALGALPEVSNLGAWYWVWDASPEQKVYRSMSISGSFQMPIEALSTEEEPPEFLVEGQFYQGQQLIVTEVEQEGEDLLRAVSLHVSGYDGTLKVRMRSSENGELSVIEADGSLRHIPYRRDGRYIVFELQNGGSFAYFKTGEQKADARLFFLIGLPVLVVLLIALSVRHRRKGKKSGKVEKENSKRQSNKP